MELMEAGLVRMSHNDTRGSEELFPPIEDVLCGTNLVPTNCDMLCLDKQDITRTSVEGARTHSRPGRPCVELRSLLSSIEQLAG